MYWKQLRSDGNAIDPGDGTSKIPLEAGPGSSHRVKTRSHTQVKAWHEDESGKDIAALLWAAGIDKFTK